MERLPDDPAGPLRARDNANSLHTNSRDEGLGTPTQETVRDAIKKIQLILSREYGLLKNENPMQGSHLSRWADRSGRDEDPRHLRGDARGGVLGSLEVNYQRNRIQEESMLYEHKKHDGSLPIIGVNTYLDEEATMLSADDADAFDVDVRARMRRRSRWSSSGMRPSGPNMRKPPRMVCDGCKQVAREGATSSRS